MDYIKGLLVSIGYILIILTILGIIIGSSQLIIAIGVSDFTVIAILGILLLIIIFLICVYFYVEEVKRRRNSLWLNYC